MNVRESYSRALEQETLTAIATHISASLVDHLHVSLAGALVGEALLAVVALVRFHPQVDPHVPVHVRALHELLRAVRASVPDGMARADR